MAGNWPGGRVDRHEIAHAGLRREIDEETALLPDVVTPVHTLVWHNDDGDDRFGVYYYCRPSERDVSPSPEHDALEWEPPAAAKTRLSDAQAAAKTRHWNSTKEIERTPTLPTPSHSRPLLRAARGRKRATPEPLLSATMLVEPS